MFLKPSQQRAISGITIGGLRTTDYTYNVKYVLGGSEKRVDAQWIQSKDPLKVNREELLAKRAKVTQQRKVCRHMEDVELFMDKHNFTLGGKG